MAPGIQQLCFSKGSCNINVMLNIKYISQVSVISQYSVISSALTVVLRFRQDVHDVYLFISSHSQPGARYSDISFAFLSPRLVSSMQYLVNCCVLRSQTNDRISNSEDRGNNNIFGCIFPKPTCNRLPTPAKLYFLVPFVLPFPCPPSCLPPYLLSIVVSTL